jgi:hypothetical protein
VWGLLNLREGQLKLREGQLFPFGQTEERICASFTKKKGLFPYRFDLTLR